VKDGRGDATETLVDWHVMHTSRLLKAAWSALWRITTFFIVWGILLAPAFVLTTRGQEVGDPTKSPLARLGLEAIVTATAILAAGLVLRFVDRLAFSRLGLGGRHSVPLFGVGLLLGLCMLATAVLSLWLLGNATVDSTARVPLTALVISGIAVFLNSVTQEVLFQGYVLQTVERYSRPLVAVPASAALFALMHGPAIQASALAGLNIFLAGFLLGTAYVFTRSLWLPIGIHFGWNFAQGPLLGMAVSGHQLGTGSQVVILQGPRVLAGGTFGLEGGVLATAVTIVGIATLFAAFGRRARDAPRRPA